VLRSNCYNAGDLGEAMAALANKKLSEDQERSQLSKQDIRLLLVICVELVNLCAKLTGKIDPASAAMLAYVRDDIQSENKPELP
jgi:hypothetical protein